MLFHTWTFAVFFLIFYPVYLLLRKTRARTPWLLLASYVFYGWLNPLYLLLLLWLTSVDYAVVVGMAGQENQRSARRRFFGGIYNPLYWLLMICRLFVMLLAGLRLADVKSKRPWLVLSLLNGLGMLAFFKYRYFVVANLNWLLAQLGTPYTILPPDLTFASDGVNSLLAWVGMSYTVGSLNLWPIGISFYVFRSLTYSIDSARGSLKEEPSFLHYATFVAMFPQILMGPIDRARDMLPQLRRAPAITRHDVADGLSLFVVGLFKKVALADFLKIYVDQVYAAPQDYHSPALILASIAFAWQIYFDFSGYTDMARGIGRLLGIRIMLNFNNPYLATGLGDFWRRWHISLSTWFRDYVYIPLGGSRKGELRTYINIGVVRLLSGRELRTYLNMAVVMLVSGLWHGAQWTFVIWGAIHAVGYGLTRHLERSPFYKERVPRLLKQLLTFSVVTLAWVFFRADSFSHACLIISRIFTSGVADPRFPLLMGFLILAVWLYQLAYGSRMRQLLAWTPIRIGLVLTMILYLAIFGGAGAQGFIYLQF
jgi:D-alanyl-lipoteichoic acid acyltransferase DltB (MBOAT superfamily)